MAFAARFPAYAVFDGGPAFCDYRNKTTHPLNVTDLGQCWAMQLQPVYTETFELL